MPRLIDKLRLPDTKWAMPSFMSSVEEWIKIATLTKQILQKADFPVLLIDNIATYMISGIRDGKTWNHKSFPNVAPPYELFWCEYENIGVFILYLKTEPEEQQRLQDVYSYGDVAWTLLSRIYLDCSDARSKGLHGGFAHYVNSTGRIVGGERSHTLVKEDDQEAVTEEISYVRYVYPALLAISFMHCKNIVIKDNSVDKPLAKKYKARHGIAPVDYKTLVIEPLKSILQREGRSREVGLIKAIHICRGHFNDYRQGNGLFGKVHDLIWMPDMIRGTKGKTPKVPEIEVRPPKIGF